MSVQMDDRPKRSVSTESSRDQDGTAMVVAPTGDLVSLNSVAFALWELCDGTTSVSEIIAAATTLFTGSPDDIERDILAGLQDLRLQRLIS